MRTPYLNRLTSWGPDRNKSCTDIRILHGIVIGAVCHNAQCTYEKYDMFSS